MALHKPTANSDGHVIVTEHEIGGVRLWALYGHLSRRSTQRTKAGARVRAGAQLGWVGHEGENGGWPLQHVHFQLSVVRPATHDMPGVVSAAQHAQALRDYPDPRLVLGPLY